MLKLTNKNNEILRIFNFYFKLVGSESLNTQDYRKLLKILSLNGSILNDDIRKVFMTIFKDQNKGEIISSLIEELTNFADNDNYQIFMKFKSDIIQTLTSIKDS